MMRETLFTERDPFPPWLRRMVPLLARLDQNPIFAANYDFMMRQRVRGGWLGTLKRNFARLDSLWIGAMVSLIVAYPGRWNVLLYIPLLSTGFWRREKAVPPRNFLRDPRLGHVPIVASDVLDAEIGASMLDLATVIPFILAVSILASLCAGIWLPSSFPLKWDFVIIVPPFIMIFTRFVLWWNFGSIPVSVARNVAISILNVQDKNWIQGRLFGQILGFFMVILFLVGAGSALVIGVVGATVPRSLAPAAAVLLAIVGFCVWEMGCCPNHDRIARKYRWAEHLLMLAIPISIRQGAGDTIEPMELERLKQLYIYPVGFS
ncbi:hypothetical protein BH09SUM1_BH09SUM1_29550 [soil metagenome]